MKRAVFWKKEKNGLRCNLCPHNCFIKQEKRGICKTRENKDGVLFSLNYGKVVALHVDPIEKKPLYHFFPGSQILSYSCWGCNFKCKFCQNWEISQREIKVPFVPPKEIVKRSKNTLGVAHTYTEPTIYYEFAFDVAKLVKKSGGKNVFVTNGYIEQKPLKKILPFIDAINIDLKSFDDSFYKKICAGSLEPVLSSIKTMVGRVWVEITNLIIPGFNDDLGRIKEMCEWIADLDNKIPLHFSAFYPSYRMLDVPQTSLNILKKAKEIGKKAGLKYVYLGNVIEDNNTYCPNCGFPVVERDYMGVKKINMKEGLCPKCGLKQDFVF